MSITEDQLAYIDEGLLLADRLLTRLRKGVVRIEHLLPLDAERLALLDDNAIGVLDIYLKRFQDAYAVGRNLFRSGLLLSGLGWPKFSYIHLVNEAERYEILPSATAWLDIMDVRNLAAHEYSMNPESQAVLLNEAVAQGRVLLEQLGAAAEFVRTRRSPTPRVE